MCRANQPSLSLVSRATSISGPPAIAASWGGGELCCRGGIPAAENACAPPTCPVGPAGDTSRVASCWDAKRGSVFEVHPPSSSPPSASPSPFPHPLRAPPSSQTALSAQTPTDATCSPRAPHVMQTAHTLIVACPRNFVVLQFMSCRERGSFNPKLSRVQFQQFVT